MRIRHLFIGAILIATVTCVSAGKKDISRMPAQVAVDPTLRKTAIEGFKENCSFCHTQYADESRYHDANGRMLNATEVVRRMRWIDTWTPANHKNLRLIDMPLLAALGGPEAVQAN